MPLPSFDLDLPPDMKGARVGENTTIAIVAIFLPVAFMTGYARRFIYPFGWTMAFAILVSMVVSFTLTPMLSSRWLTPGHLGGGVEDTKHHRLFRALAVLRRLRARAGRDLTLVGVGGIGTVDDARERIEAGADLLQAYTAFIYGGPLWPARLNRALQESV